TAGPGSIWNVTSSMGVARVAVTSTSSPSKQRDGAAVTAASSACGRVPRPAAARAARAGAPSSSRLACRVSTAARATATAGVDCQTAGCHAGGAVAGAGSVSGAPRAVSGPSVTLAAPVRRPPLSWTGPGDGFGGEYLRDQVRTGHPAHPHLGPQHQPVRQGGDGDRLDVLRVQVVAWRQ